MVAGLLSRPKRQFYSLENNIGNHFSFITKIPGDTFLTKMLAELPSTEQIFTETSRLVPLILGIRDRNETCVQETVVVVPMCLCKVLVTLVSYINLVFIDLMRLLDFENEVMIHFSLSRIAANDSELQKR